MTRIQHPAQLAQGCRFRSVHDRQNLDANERGQRLQQRKEVVSRGNKLAWLGVPLSFAVAQRRFAFARPFESPPCCAALSLINRLVILRFFHESSSLHLTPLSLRSWVASMYSVCTSKRSGFGSSRYCACGYFSLRAAVCRLITIFRALIQCVNEHQACL